jgi:hypothetical protein
MGYAAKVIALDDVRVNHQRQALRQQLHERFDRWLDELEAQLIEPKPTLAQVSETIWALRQQLTSGVAQTILEHTHQDERRRQHLRCASCACLLKARLRCLAPPRPWWVPSSLSGLISIVAPAA